MSTPFQALSSVANACQVLPDVITGGQPAAEDLERYGQSGGGVLLDLRDPMEPRPLDEPALAGKLGLEYVNVPVGTGTLTDRTLERVLSVLREASRRKRPAFVHCASGSRVGAVLIPYLMLDHGLEEDDAVGQAMRVGLRSAELMEWGLEYARKQRALGTDVPRAF